jgi:hypothetical protein
MGCGSKSSSGVGTTGQPTSKQKSKQDEKQATSSASNDSAPASTIVPQTDQKAAPLQDLLDAQDTGDHAGDSASESVTPVADQQGSLSGVYLRGDSASESGTPVATIGLQVLSASPTLSRQISAQAALCTTERVATTLQPVAESVAVFGSKLCAPERVATTLQPSSVAANGDKEIDGGSQTDANAAGTAVQAGAGVVALAAGETFELKMAQPTTTDIANKADSVQPAGKATQKTVVDAAGSKNSNLTNTTDTGKAKIADAVSAVTCASSNGAQSNEQSMQHSQPDGSQATVILQKVVNDGAAQVQAIPMHAAIHSAATTPNTPSGVQNGTYSGVERGDTGASPLDGGEQTVPSSINAAKLIQTMGETEMRVGMHTADFGNISIRTSVSQQQMLTQISLDHSDLSQAISAHISSVQAKLGNDYGLQALIQVNHQGAFASASGDQGSSQRREQSAFSPSVRSESTAVPAELDVGMSPAVITDVSAGYRLDIRA